MASRGKMPTIRRKSLSAQSSLTSGLAELSWYTPSCVRQERPSSDGSEHPDYRLTLLERSADSPG